MKYKNRLSILTIQYKFKGKIKLSFGEIFTQDIKTKARQVSDIPTKIIKENIDVFVDLPCTNLISSIKSSLFLSCPKFGDVTPLYKKRKKRCKSKLYTSKHFTNFTKTL